MASRFDKIKKSMLSDVKGLIRRLNYTDEKYIEEFNILSFTNCKTLEEVAEEMAKEYFSFKKSCKKEKKEDELPSG